MKKSKLTVTIMAMLTVAAIGFAAIAIAGPHYGQMWGPHHGMQSNVSPEHNKAMQDAYIKFDQKTQPLQQQLYAKQAELDALYYNGTPPNDPKVQSLMKEMVDLDMRLSEAHLEIRKQMAGMGIPFYGGRMEAGYGGHAWHGGGRGGGCGGGHGWGRGHW